MRLHGWHITYWTIGLILLAVVLLLASSPWNPDSIKIAIRSTGRSSLFLFSIAVTASSVYYFWKAPFSKWVLQNRRYIGVSFAASHFIHLGLIALVAIVFPEPFLEDQARSQWIFGGIGYVFVALMALTSFRQSPALVRHEKLEKTASHWCLLPLVCFLYDLYQTYQNRSQFLCTISRLHNCCFITALNQTL